jgi:hypothetical protein
VPSTYHKEKSEIDRATAERFLAKLHIGRDDECWEWAGAKAGGTGYGSFSVDGKNQRGAHRVAYEWEYGPILDKRCVCHHCDNRLCCNPAHLFLGTHKDNMQDAARKGRLVQTWQGKFPERVCRGSALPASKLTESDVIQMRELHRKGAATYSDLARQYGVAPNTVWQAVNINGKHWKHVPRGEN